MGVYAVLPHWERSVRLACLRAWLSNTYYFIFLFFYICSLEAKDMWFVLNKFDPICITCADLCAGNSHLWLLNRSCLKFCFGYLCKSWRFKFWLIFLPYLLYGTRHFKVWSNLMTFFDLILLKHTLISLARTQYFTSSHSEKQCIRLTIVCDINKTN